jgi:hypothetical protein
MAVYVDNMKAPYGRMVMCHMAADTRDELLEMAKAIGVQEKWLQKPGTWQEHFDICLSKRSQAIARGAIAVTTREIVLGMRAHREDHLAKEKKNV